MNSVAKGKRNEKKTEKYFTALEAKVETVKHVKSFGKQDFFGLFDHIVVTGKPIVIEAEKGNTIAIDKEKVIFVQTKTNVKPGPAIMKSYYDFKVDAVKLLFIWKDRVKLPRIILLEEKVND